MAHITHEHVVGLMDSASIQEHVFFGKVLVRAHRLPSGFVVLGVSGCVDRPEEFDVSAGRSLADADAERQIWALEGYCLQGKLAEQSAIALQPSASGEKEVCRGQD